MNHMAIYDIIYALAAREGRERTLFGSCAPAARNAFSRCLVGDTFPELWFELPLSGEPWFDFHALASYEDIAGTQAMFAGHSGIYNDVLSWFASQEPKTVRQLALSYDTSRGDVEHPAVQLLRADRDDEIPTAFLQSVGRQDASKPYCIFAHSIPQEWHACYVGVFPRRIADNADPWIRVECIVNKNYQQAYADDATILREHLTSTGMEIFDSDMIAAIQKLAGLPFPLELQFNVGQNGTALPVLSASMRFQPDDWIDAERRNAIGHLAIWMQTQGLTDDRCVLLEKTLFAKQVEYQGETAFISCFPAFVKLRFREGQAPDAKAYLLARVQ